MLSKLVKRKIVIEKPDKAGVTPSMICLRTNKFDVFQIFSKVREAKLHADRLKFVSLFACNGICSSYSFYSIPAISVGCGQS